jgi:hypothetical protein
MAHPSSWFLVTVAVVVACGGKATIDGGGGAGGSGASGSGASGSGASSSGASGPGAGAGPGSGGSGQGGIATGSGGATPDCDSLQKAYEETLAAAMACNACQGFDGCFNGPELQDLCGCPVVANVSNDADVMQARELWEQLQANGCAPLDCKRPCAASKVWGCLPGSSGSCQGNCNPQ